MNRIALLAPAGLLMVACATGGEVESPSTTESTTTEATTTTVSETTSTSVSTTALVSTTTEALWPPPDLPDEADGIATKPLQAGTFVTSRFAIPMTFEVVEDGDWRIRGEDEEQLVLVSWIYDALPAAWWGAFAIFVTGPEVDEAIGEDFVAAVRDDPCTGKMQGPTDMVVAGWSGVMVETQIPEDPSPPYGGGCTFFGRRGGLPPTGLDLDHTRIIEIEVDDRRLITQLLAPSKNDLRELIEKADRLFATMTIGD